jgi:hypothetical protein
MKGRTGSTPTAARSGLPVSNLTARPRGLCYAALHPKERTVARPDYLICLNCEAACYVFEWENDEVTEAYCELCTSEETDQFLTQEDFDALIEA